MPVPTRTSADANSSADINTLQSQITAGVAFTLSTPGTNQTLTSSSAVRQSMAPSVDINVTLDNSFSAGSIMEIHNTSTTKVLTLKSNDGDTICKIIPLSYLVIMAKQATPTDATHWSTKNAGGGYTSFAIGTTQGFGSITDSGECLVKREGPNAILIVSFLTGGGSGSEARFELPFGLTTSTLTGITPVSNIGYGNVSTYNVIADSAKTYLNFWSNAGAPTTLEADNGNTFTTTSGAVIVFTAIVPISGWELNG